MAGPDPIPGSPVPGAHIWGWMTEEELTWLGEQAACMDSVVEVGSLRGRSAFALLTTCPGPVYCIDPWNDVADESYPAFMEACGHFENLRAIRGLSPAAAEGVPGVVDMVFLDGDHAYDAVMADIEAWLPKTRKLLCGHDYHSDGYPGVTEAVHEVFGDRARGARLEGWSVEDSSIWMVEL